GTRRAILARLVHHFPNSASTLGNLERASVTGRICLLAFVAATGAVQLLPYLPARALWLGVLAGAAILSFSIYLFAPAIRWRVLLPMWAALAGLLITVARAEHRLADELAAINENQVSRVVLRIAALPKSSND